MILSREYDEAPTDSELVVTTFLFRVRNLPASLYKALGVYPAHAYRIEGEHQPR